MTRRIQLLHVVLLACVALVASAIFPARAFAYYNQAADSFPAAQDLGSYGEVLYGSEIPDGAYVVGARTTSRMCLMYTNYDDCAARVNSELAVINVQDGNILAVFYLSSAYNRIYFGTQEEAASLAADGDDDSPFIAGDPVDGYAPHLYAFNIPALNSPITIATYSGGQGYEQGRWYTREFVFTSTDEIYAAIENAASGGEEDPSESGEGDETGTDTPSGQENNGDAGGESGSEPDGGETPDTAGADTGADQSGDEGGFVPAPQDGEGWDDDGSDDGAGQEPESQGNEESADGEQGEEGVQESGGENDLSSEAAQSTGSTPQSNDESAQEESQAEEGNGTAAASVATASNGGKVGVLMSFVDPGIELSPPQPDVPKVEQPVEESKGLTPQQILAITVLALAMLGAVWRGCAFRLGIR